MRNEFQFTTSGRISILYSSTLTFWFEESRPVALIGVAQVLVLNNNYISITNFSEGAKAQVLDIELNNNHTAATTIEGKKVEQEEKKDRKDFMTALNNTQLTRNKFMPCDPVVVNLQGVFTRNIPLCSSSNDLQILKRTEWAHVLWPRLNPQVS